MIAIGVAGSKWSMVISRLAINGLTYWYLQIVLGVIDFVAYYPRWFTTIDTGLMMLLSLTGSSCFTLMAPLFCLWIALRA